MNSYVQFLTVFCLYHYTFEVSRFSHYRRNRRNRVVLISCIVFILSCNECNVVWILEQINGCARQWSATTHNDEWKPAESTCCIFNYPVIILVTHVKSRWLSWAARQTKAFNFQHSGGTGGLADYWDYWANRRWRVVKIHPKPTIIVIEKGHF